jgi:hypothetical protein
MRVSIGAHIDTPCGKLAMMRFYTDYSRIEMYVEKLLVWDIVTRSMCIKRGNFFDGSYGWGT